jgi:glycosyltransferase involved in cell wall biosynthesis
MISSPPLVSVIIPCHNSARWLPATLESALAQTWPRLEIIVVDDGSRDDSAAIAARYAARGVQLVQQPNRGAAAARNQGIALAHGDYFQFLDADDLLAPDKIAQQIERLKDKTTSVATCAWARFHRNPTEARFMAEPLWTDSAPADWLVRSWETHTMMATAAWLLPRTIAESIGPWNTGLGRNPIDDMEYFSRALLSVEQVIFCPDARVYYRSGLRNSLSQQRSDEAWNAIFESFHRTIDRLFALENSSRTHHAGAVALQRLVYEAYPRVPILRSTAETRIRMLGGCEIKPAAGPWRRRLQAFIGWKATKRLHDWLYRPRFSR